MSQGLSFNLNLPIAPDTKNPELFGELLKLYNSTKLLAAKMEEYLGLESEDSSLWESLSPVDTIRLHWHSRLYIKYTEDVSVGQVVTIYDDLGTPSVKLAGGASYAGHARGFCSVVGGVSAGDFGEVILFGLNPYHTGLAPGAIYYLSNTTAGQITATIPIETEDSIIHAVGFAVSSTCLFFNPTTEVPRIALVDQDGVHKHIISYSPITY